MASRAPFVLNFNHRRCQNMPMLDWSDTKSLCMSTALCSARNVVILATCLRRASERYNVSGAQSHTPLTNATPPARAALTVRNPTKQRQCVAPSGRNSEVSAAIVARITSPLLKLELRSTRVTEARLMYLSKPCKKTQQQLGTLPPRTSHGIRDVPDVARQTTDNHHRKILLKRR